MPVFRVNNFVDAYRLRARSEDIHDLAARSNKKALTDFVSREISKALNLEPNDVLVDIGCGDGSLLKIVRGHVSQCIGTTGSIEEKTRLESAIPGVSFIASPAQQLPLASAIASKVVCNATLFYLPSENDVQAALREMARIAMPGATVWVGEIPDVDEFRHYGMYCGTSMLEFLWHLLKRNGIRSFLGMIRRWAKALVGREQIVLNSARIFYASPQKLITLAESCGLRIKTYFRHMQLDDGGNVIHSEFRYDYVFTV